MNSRAVALIIFVLFSALYIGTMCPTVYTMDNGELIVAASGLRIAHPTGYPLFCLLSKLGTIIIPFGSIALRINATNAIIAGAAIATLFLALCQVARKESAIIVAALFGLSPIFWEVATSADVHALTGLLVSAELLLFLRWWKIRETRLLYGLAFVVGLTAANHLSAMLIVPGLLLGVFMHDRSIFRNREIVLKSVLFSIIPIFLYVYLPARSVASQGTIWGDIYAAAGFWAHVTGQFYRSRMFSLSTLLVWRNLLAFFNLLIMQFPLYVAWLLPIGAVKVRRRLPGLLLPFALMVLVNVFYAINYDIPDIEPYYLPAMLISAVFATAGLSWVVERLQKPAYRTVAFAGSAAVVLLIASSNFGRCDKHNTTYIMNYGQNVLATAPKNAFIVACGDATYNATLYARMVEGQRPDLIIAERNITKAWMRGDSNWTGRYYYENAAKLSKAMQTFCGARNYSKRDIRSEKFLADVVAAVMSERPVYLDCPGNQYYKHPIVQRLEKSFQLVPEGVLFRVLPKSQQVDTAKLVDYNEKLWSSYKIAGIADGSIRGGELEREVPERYALFRMALADIELGAGMYAKAENGYKWALSADSTLNRARNGLGVALATQGAYRDAIKQWEVVLSRDPNDKMARHGITVVERNLSQTR